MSLDPNAAARTHAAWSHMVQGNAHMCRDMLRLLDPLQLLQVQLSACRLIAAAGEVVDEQLLASALLTPDALPDDGGLEVCTWCGRMDCENRFDHSRLHGGSETTWRETAKGTRP